MSSTNREMNSNTQNTPIINNVLQNEVIQNLTNQGDNNHIRVDTLGYIRGTHEGAGFEEETVITEPMHNGLVDIASKEWHYNNIEIKTLGVNKRWSVFSNDKVGMSPDQLRNIQLMANYQGARTDITGLYGVGLVALRSFICGETGKVHMISLQNDVDDEYDNVDKFMEDMRDAGTNQGKINAIHYSMKEIMSGRTLIRDPEDLPSTAVKLWKQCSVNPLKAGTVMAYECTPEHIRFLDAQAERDVMDFHNMKYCLLFSAQDTLGDDKKIKFLGEDLTRIPSLEDYNTHLNNSQTFMISPDIKHKTTTINVEKEITRTKNKNW